VSVWRDEEGEAVLTLPAIPDMKPAMSAVAKPQKARSGVDSSPCRPPLSIPRRPLMPLRQLTFITALAIMLTSHAMAQKDVRTASIHIDVSRVENHVSPRMYAGFVEMMAEDVKRGLTAEMLLDRSFEQPTDYLGLPAHWQLEPDERNDNVGAIKFVQTTDDAYPRMDQATNTPNHSLKITLTPGDITDMRRGLSQGRLSVRAGESYKMYLWARLPPDQGYKGQVRVALEADETDGATYAQATLTLDAGDWQRYTVSLTPNTTDRFAKLSLLFDGKGILFLDQLSLEPDAARTEVRPDSEAMIGELHPSFIRWPGGNVAQDYHWQWGIGPRDLRPVWINKAWSNAPEPNDLGTDEYLALCNRLHIEPSITVNVNGAGATPEEAAAWVEYVNGPATSTYGSMRAANGHPAPYGVHQWELGNEIFGDWVRGHVTAEQYAQAAVRYAQAMRAVDPTIKLIAVGEGIFPNSDAWNSAVLRIAGSSIQYLAVHDYTSLAQNATAPNPRDTMMSRATEYEANYRHMGDLIRQNAPEQPIKLIVNEWNLFYGADVIQSMEGAVYASRMMNGFERDGDIVDANSISDLLNGWVGGVIQASRDRVYGTSQFYAIEMYSEHLGTDRLRIDINSPELPSGLKVIDAAATRSTDGTKLFVKLSNADPTQAITTSVDLGASAHPANVEFNLLAAPGGHQRNTFTAPRQIIPARQALHCERICTVTLPADSVAVLTFGLTTEP
jgi:alpha-L-arabinofuranosidase